MQKISSSTATANGAGEFTKGLPGSGVDATMITVDWLNAIQRELVNLVVGSGQTLAPADDGQVLKAVKALQELASAWDKISGKPTTRNGYALSDVFTKTETGTAIQQAIAAWVGTAPAALDTLVELAASLGNDPNFATTVMNALAAKMPTTGGAYNPKFSGASFNAEARGYNGSGGFIGWGADASGTMQFICNKGSGNTGGFVFGSVNADNASLGPLMTYTPGGALGVPAALSVPAITSNTTVSTQSPGYAGSYIVNGAFVAAAVQYKVNGSSCIEVGFVGGDVAAPYLKHTNGTVVRVQVDRPKDTALLDPTGWSKNADTGEIRQWLEVDAGDIPTTKSINVAWQFQFPNAITSVRISIRKTNTSTACVQAYYRNPTRDGCTIDIEEWSGVVQSGLVICVEARGK